MTSSGGRQTPPVNNWQASKLTPALAERAKAALAESPSLRTISVQEQSGARKRFVFLSHASDVCAVLRDPARFRLLPYDTALEAITDGVTFFLSAREETLAARRQLRESLLPGAGRRAAPGDFGIQRHARETAGLVIEDLLMRGPGAVTFDAVREYGTFVPYLTAVRAFGVAGDPSPGLTVRLVQLLRALAARRWLRAGREAQAMQSLFVWTLIPTGHIFTNVDNRDERLAWLARRLSRRLERQIDTALGRSDQAPAGTLLATLHAQRPEGDRSEFERHARAMIYEFVGSVVILVSQGFARVLEAIRAEGEAVPDFAARLSDDDTARAWIDECLRLKSPTGQLQRIAAETVDLDGIMIERGDHLFLLIDAASRDAARFADPDTFRANRPAGAYLHFGCDDSAHACFGQDWARAIIREMLVQFARLPELAFIEGREGELRAFSGFPESLRMRFHGKARAPA